MTGSKKNLLNCSAQIGRINLVSRDDDLPIKRQCELLEVNRSSFYYKEANEHKPNKNKEAEERIKRRIDYWHTKMCYLGVRKLRKLLQHTDGLKAGRKLIRRLMGEMGLYAVYPKPNLSKSNKAHKKFPYLLKNLPITKPNQVWAIDITYIPMGKTHLYLTAIIDWYSRFIVGWELSDTLETAPVIQALNRAIEAYGAPEIINSDQGSQFTSTEYINFIKEKDIRQSMDGKARWVDNVIIERWFRSLKCDNIYINEYENPRMLRMGVRDYILEYNTERPHQNLDYKCPKEVYFEIIAA